MIVVSVAQWPPFSLRARRRVAAEVNGQACLFAAAM